MEKVAIVFTVFFEDPFWCGVYQRLEGNRLEAARVVFGPKPKDYEVHAFLLQNWKRLRFGKTSGEKIAAERKNPKRMQREARKQMSDKGIGTSAGGTENRAEGQIQRGKTGGSRTKIPAEAGKASGKAQRTLKKGKKPSPSFCIN